MCAKLQGFTYSGGLLRHEREVHNKHGGPKEKLQCPFEDCKRHEGNGFTRRENLNEHIRRVHEKTKGDVPDHPETEIATAWSKTDTPPQIAPSTSRKREWNEMLSPEPSDGDKGDVHGEVKRLRAEIDLIREERDRLRGELISMRAASRTPPTGGFRPM